MVNAEARRVRRDAFLDVAQRLIQTQGYERMSVQAVLDELGASKGAFYHYFDSKQDLLDGVVERFAEVVMTAVAPILADPTLTALRKLERVFRTIASFKAEQKELVLAIIEVWSSDANALLREKLRRLATRRLVPLLAAIVRQGVEEGVVSSGSPEDTARVIGYLILGYQELAVDLFRARRAGTVSLEEVRRAFAAETRALERILGAPEGSITLLDEDTLRFWFG
ncbi:MAG TPA: TetR/AcrR family transcriptional regulator [Candidatus Dormibacteraeota bacterium]|jgi:AcrR family transcriptional regulator|nr:TetR/AcrR family transcriptional regulator [Candidatus Dormibacteraeota bacterium]